MRGKFTGKVSTSPASARQEMTRTEDYANGDAQCLQSGGAAESNNASRNGDDWGVSLSSSADPWGPSSSGGDYLDSTNQVNGDERRDEECRHCRGAHKSDECPESRGGGSGSDRRQDTRVCHTCGQEGHISKYCRQNSGDRQWGGDRRSGNDRSYGSAPAMERCAICEGKGHRAEACPTPRDFLQRESNNDRQSPPRSGRPQQAQVSCHRCNATDHYAHNCPTRVGYEADKDDVSGPYDHIVTISEGEAINRNRIGENFARFDDVQVKVTNSNGSETNEYENRKLKTFRDANLVESVMAKIAELKFDDPSPVQRYAIPILADGKDLIACAQTGSGKTAAFVLPIVDALIRSNCTVERGRTQRPYALILAPTRELVVQITKDAQHFSRGSQVEVKECYGGTKLPSQIGNIQKGCHVLVCTAGRFEDFLRREIISLSEMRYLVLDEADRMLDRGFSQTVINIKDHHSRNKSIESQTIMFSATFPREVQDLARKLLREGFLKLDVGVVGTVCQDVSQYVEEIKGLGRKKDRLLELIEKEMEENSAAKVLVFVETKRTADTIASYLSELRIKATSMHGDRLQEQREKALRDFQKNDCHVLVATSVAARGLDITNVGHVVNFDLPKDIDEYVHRVGRTGRVGNKGRATSFFDSEKDYLMRDPLRQSFLDGGQEAPSFL